MLIYFSVPALFQLALISNSGSDHHLFLKSMYCDCIAFWDIEATVGVEKGTVHLCLINFGFLWLFNMWNGGLEEYVIIP